jgi:hypothetical protein
MTVTRKPVLIYTDGLQGEPLIQIYHCTFDTARCIPCTTPHFQLADMSPEDFVESFFYCFQVPVSEEHPTGVVHGFDFPSLGACSSRAKWHYSKFHKLPRYGVWR